MYCAVQCLMALYELAELACVRFRLVAWVTCCNSDGSPSSTSSGCSPIPTRSLNLTQHHILLTGVLQSELAGQTPDPELMVLTNRSFLASPCPCPRQFLT